MPAYTTKTAPIICIIARDSPMEKDIDEIVGWLRESPPTLLHGGDDMTYPSHGRVRLTGEEAKARNERTRRWTEAVHAAGVEWVVPYVCNGHIFGNPYTRTGMWWLYDHWHEHAKYLGPKLPVDPVEWVQREPDGKPHYNYPYRFLYRDPPEYELAACVNNPHWREWTTRIVKLVAAGGFDGVFADNNIHHCYCEYCQREFKAYLTETYTPAALRERFDTDDVSELRLSTHGNKVLWAKAQRAYLQEIRDNEPEEFKKKFGTDDMDAAVVSEAGNGFHWGRAHNYWLRTLRKRHSPEEVERILREGDISSLGVTTAKERCLWADTQKFWAWSIGRWQARLRAAAEEVCGRFLIMPNWGDMAGFRNTDSRRLEAKNVHLWKPGADIIFFEQQYYPCALAPGYTFDLIIPYKYAAACAIRSSVLPYRGAEHRALCELAMAEAAAWSGDGTFIQVRYKFPEIRRAYGAFYKRHAEWYAGRTSHADVGLLLSFDEIHMENTHHMREAYSLAHYLVDHHILFDFLCEGQVTLEELRRFKVVILPHVEFLPARARGAVMRYLDEGGCVLITGNTGACDEHARPNRRDDVLARMRVKVWPDGHLEREGRLAWIGDVYSWLPKRAWQMHDLADFEFGTFKDEVLDKVIAASKEEPADDPRLANLLDELAGCRLSVLGQGTPQTLRAAAWMRTGDAPSGDSASLVLHLVNYHVPGTELHNDIHTATEKQVEPVPVEEVGVSLPLPEAMKVRKVFLADPWNPEPEPLAFQIRGGRVHFTVPRVTIYRAVRIGG